MTSVVVDTDVVSFLFKNHPIGGRYDPELEDRMALISFMTVAEIERWCCNTSGGRIAFARYRPISTDSRLFLPAPTFAASGRK